MFESFKSRILNLLSYQKQIAFKWDFSQQKIFNVCQNSQTVINDLKQREPLKSKILFPAAWNVLCWDGSVIKNNNWWRMYVGITAGESKVVQTAQHLSPCFQFVSRQTYIFSKHTYEGIFSINYISDDWLLLLFQDL